MATETNPAAATNYHAHPMGQACVDCGRAANIGKPVHHASYCDIAPRMAVLPEGQELATPSKRSARRGTDAASTIKRSAMQHAAKGGHARAQHSDADIALAVRNGEITESDAMNQDC